MLLTKHLVVEFTSYHRPSSVVRSLLFLFFHMTALCLAPTARMSAVCDIAKRRFSESYSFYAFAVPRNAAAKRLLLLKYFISMACLHCYHLPLLLYNLQPLKLVVKSVVQWWLHA